MPSYVLLIKAHDISSARTIGGGVEGMKRQAQALARAGATNINQRPVIGHYDFVTTVDFADEKHCLAIQYALQAIGYTVEPLRAFSPEELGEALDLLPGGPEYPNVAKAQET